MEESVNAVVVNAHVTVHAVRKCAVHQEKN